jgi:hypothetical protein
MGVAKGRQRLTAALQMLGMMERFPALRLVSRNPLIWRGPVIPIEGGRAFTLEVRFALPTGVPSVRVIGPKLEAEPTTGRPPHTFADGTLCLYHTSDFTWTGDRFIAETIVPWACEWCLFYEVWVSTGKWLGPAYPHSTPKTPQRAESARERRDRAA